MTDGARTRDPKDHNLVLYQLSYSHQLTPAEAGMGRPKGEQLLSGEAVVSIPVGLRDDVRDLQ